MKSLRNIAAQYDVRNRITKASLGGTIALFCFPFGLPAHADDVTTLPVQDATPVATAPSSLDGLSVATPMPSDTQQQQSGLEQTAQTQLPVTSLTSIAEKIDTATVTVQTAVDNATAVLQTVPNVQTIAPTLPAAQSAIDSATAVVQAVTVAIQAAQSALTTATNASVLMPIAQASVDTATVTVASAQSSVDTATATAALAQSEVDGATAAVANQTGSVATDQTTIDGATVAVATAQTNVDNQTVVVTVATTTAADAQAAADASAVTGTVQAPGLIAKVYSYQGSSSPALPGPNAVPLLTTVVPQITYNWGSGSVLGGPADRVIVVFTGQITAGADMNIIKYAVYSDDGAKLYINGNLVVNNWRDQGPNWSPYSTPIDVSTNKTQDITLYYYENGGGAVATLGWMVNNAYFTSPTSVNFSHPVTGTVKDPVLVQAAADAQVALTTAQTTLNNYQTALTDAQTALATAQAQLTTDQATLDTLTQNLTTAQQNLTNAQATLAETSQNLADAQQNLTTQQSVLAVAQATADSTLTAANAAADAAITAANDASKVLASSAATIVQVVSDKIAADIAAKAAADAAAAQALLDAQIAKRANQASDPVPTPPAPEPAPSPAETPNPTPDPAPTDSASGDVTDSAGTAADASPSTPDPTVPSDTQPTDSTTPTDSSGSSTKDTSSDSSPTQTPETPKPTTPETTAPATPNLVPNNPSSLPDTIPVLPPVEALVAHIQVDKPGVENGGIQFFGTKTAPQVVGEDGKLTPPAPPPGSGLPIPPEAITTTDTFIGQPGGTAFNAPDIAVPVIEKPVTGAIAAVPGVQALNHAFVAMANIGNDMSPVTRKKAKKILVVTTVITAVRRKFGN